MSHRPRTLLASSSTLTLTFGGPQITAAAKETRTIRGRVLPYDTPGSTSAGRVRIKAGALELPEDSREVVLLNEHYPTGRSVGVAVELTDGPTELTAAFRVARTAAGDELLAEADPEVPVRAGLSVELADVAFSDDEPDLVVHARLVAVAAVPVPAYRTARVTSVAAAHVKEGTPPVTLEELMRLLGSASGEQRAALAASLAPSTPLITPANAVPAPAELQAREAAELQAAAAPEGVPTGRRETAGRMSLDRLVDVHARLYNGERSPELLAALQDVTYSAHPATRAPEYAGELWSGAAYVRQFLQLVNNKPLRSVKGTGFRWVQKPRVQNYAGDKADVPSNQVVTEPAEWTAERVAGAWDVDRAFYDFPNPEFWRGFYEATTESYRMQTDDKVLQFLITKAVAAEGEAGKAGYVVAQPDVLRATAVLSAVLQNRPTVRQRPTFVLMNTGDFLGLLDFTGLDVPAFLKLMGVDPDAFRHADAVPAGRVIAGVGNAVEYREMGDVPIRVEAVDIARGGVDTGVFGYCSLFEARPGGVLSLPIAPVVG